MCKWKVSVGPKSTLNQTHAADEVNVLPAREWSNSIGCFNLWNVIVKHLSIASYRLDNDLQHQ